MSAKKPKDDKIEQNQDLNNQNMGTQANASTPRFDFKNLNLKKNNEVDEKPKKVKEKQPKQPKEPKTKEPKAPKEPKEPKLKKEKKKGQTEIDPLLAQRTDEVNNMFKTPPAGVYPKTDSQGRVIKYKKRGGVWAFFVGIFFSLFLFVFCGGLVASYFYYCYKIEDLGNTLGVNTKFLPVDTKNKTANEIVSILKEYKDGYTNMTVSDAKAKLGLDIEEIVEKNLGIEVQNFYDIEISLKDVNNGQKQKVGNLRLQDIINNTKDFIDALLPELYKQVSVGSVFDLANIDLNLNKPIAKGQIFDVTPNPTFDLQNKTYTINFAEGKVENKELEFSTELKNNKFTINSIEYTISKDKTKLSYGETGTKTLIYDHHFKTLEELTVDELLNSVVPNYLGGEFLTIKFLQEALDITIIDLDKAETAEERAELLDMLNTNLNNLKIDELLDCVSIRSLEKLLDVAYIPLDDEAGRYDSVLDKKIGEITVADLKDGITMGALLDLIKVELPDLPFLSEENFKTTLISGLSSYLTSLKVSDFIKNIIEEVHPYQFFTVYDNNYYVDTSANKVYTKIHEEAGTYDQITTIGGQDVIAYNIYLDKYLLYKDYLYRMTSSTITANEVLIDGTTYLFDPIERTLTNSDDLSVIQLVSGKFEIKDGTETTIIGHISNDEQRIVYFKKCPESKVTGRLFRLNFLGGVDYKTETELFDEDTTITFRLDKDSNIEYLTEVAKIENDKFTLTVTNPETTLEETKEYTVSTTEVTTTTDAYPLTEKSQALDIAIYSIADLTIQNVIDGNLSELISDDGRLNNLLLIDVIGKEFGGLLGNLNGLTVGEIIDYPGILLEKIQVITLGEIMAIDDITNPSSLLTAIKDLTIDDLMNNANVLIETMGSVTFEDLGITGDSPFINKLKTISIQNVLDGDLGDIIKDIKLSEITGNQTTGIMAILGDVKLGDFDGDDVITNKLKNSYANLAELLDQTIYFYPYFEKDAETNYVVEEETIGNFIAEDGIYKQTNKYKITFEYDSSVPITYKTFEYNNRTLDITSDKLKENLVVVTYNQSGTDKEVLIVNNKFIFEDDKIFIISGSYVYELTKDTSITSYSLSTAKDEVVEINGTPCSYDLTKDSLNKAILSLRVKDLFDGNFANSLKDEIQDIRLSEILSDAAKSNQLLGALLDKNPDITISTLGDTINTLTMYEIFSTADFDNGVLSLMNIKDTPLLDVVTEIESFDFSTQTMNDLIDKQIVNFNTTEYAIELNVVQINGVNYAYDGINKFSDGVTDYYITDGKITIGSNIYIVDLVHSKLILDKNTKIKTNFGTYTITDFIEYILDVQNKRIAELMDKGLLEENTTIRNNYGTKTLNEFFNTLAP